MKKIILCITFCFAIPISTQTYAANATVDIDVHASTLGLGAGFAMPISESLAGRVSFSKYSYTYQSTSDQINYDSTLKLENIAALADWHLFNGVTHLTGGFIYNNNGFTMNAVPTGTTFTVNGTAYSTAAITGLTADISFNKFVPYLGFGWSGRASKTGFSFKSDIGIMFQGSPKTTLSATGSSASDPTFVSNLAASEAQLNKDMSGFDKYLVISLGMGYAF